MHSRTHDADAVECVTGDILDGSSLRGAMRSCDGVIHLAAVADVDQVALDPLRADLVNTRGTAVVLEAARDEEIRHVVYGSTIWVYGNAPGAQALDEDVLLASPDHFYTATKLAGEMYCRSYGRMFGLAPTILRFGIPHGPRVRARHGRREVRRARARGRADQHQRRRQPGAPVRLRRGSRRRHRRSA